MHTFQVTVENYKADHGVYPKDSAIRYISGVEKLKTLIITILPGIE